MNSYWLTWSVSGSNQTVALNCDVLINIDIIKSSTYNTTQQPMTVVYKKLPSKDISDVNAGLRISEVDHVLGHKLHSDRDLRRALQYVYRYFCKWRCPQLIEKNWEEAQKNSTQLRYVLRDLAAEVGAFVWVQAIWQISTLLLPIIKLTSTCLIGRNSPSP